MDDEYLNSIRLALNEVLDREVEIANETSLRSDLNIDSIDMMVLYMALEKSFTIEIPDSDLTEDHFDVVSNIIAYVKKKQSET
jgi:acyl carrier protein